MSMMARFVAVTPERLKAIQKSPDLVEEVLAHVSVSGSTPLELTPEMQERVRARAHMMGKDTLDRMPLEMRQQLASRLGVAESDLKTGLADAILKKMGPYTFPAGLRPRPDDPATKSISLEKAWHGLHYLLCGAAEPVPGALGQAVLGGVEIGEDLGYGPARYFSAAEVSEIARALDDPTLEQTLHARFNPALMEQHGLYPGGWDQEGDDWLIDAFRELRDFYAAASEVGNAVIAVIE